jgi:hypothetical protein
MQNITHSVANDQLLYFTSTSLSTDDRHLVFISDRDGNPNLYTRDLVSGQERPVTAIRDGLLKSYVYFNGTAYRGFGKASVSFDPERRVLYYLHGRQICRADLEGRVSVLAELPMGQMTAFTHVSSDGRRLCVPTVDARALDGEASLAGQPEYDIDQRVREEGLSSWLRVFDTHSGEELLAERVKGGWVTHVQFSPCNANVILYNHEWSSDGGIRRMWLWDGRTHRQLRTEGQGRSRADWTCHEMWSPNGEAVIYHGSYAGGEPKRSYLGRVEVESGGTTEIAFPADFTKYGHFIIGPHGRLVSDGYYRQPTDAEPASFGGDWISLIDPDWQAGTLRWTPLCRHGSSWSSQDAHPHPIFSHRGDQIYFTSDRDGRRAVYAVATVNG